MANDLAKLNRLRVNAGKAELKSWKASQAKLDDAISKLEAEGFKDVVPGANLEAEAKTNDPEVAKARPAPEPTVGKPSLARGIDSDGYSRHSRERVRDLREKEKKALKGGKVKLSDAEKKSIKDEAEHRKGLVDAKKDPEKAARQQKHIADKKAKREASGKPINKKEVGKDEITVADIARDLDIDPKVARAKLRRHEDKLTKLHTKGQDRWTFPKTARKDIEKILKGSK